MMKLLSLARLAYGGLTVAVFVLAVAPIHEPSAAGSDKLNHLAAFYTLGVGAAVVFPRLRLWLAGLLLVTYGGFIEVVQGLPFVGRDADVMDLLTDAVGVAAALAPFALWPLRQRFGGGRPSP